ncbi:helix-turn-helix domain-containing protein [Solibacillus sp. FSL H8-0538]|uniref:helix-turn-helix domain-containing protein n=1 Tax=Solibacillus sp. FSL H8-0538 TaxID=2921400 RepID=UPI0030F66227
MGREIEIKLKGILKDRGMEQKDLAALTKLSNRTISELVNNKVVHVPKVSLCKIADALEIDDIRELIDFKQKKDRYPK